MRGSSVRPSTTVGLPPSAYTINGVEYYGGVAFLKAGLASADAITTVSPTYAKEILTPEFGMGLEDALAARGVATRAVRWERRRRR